MALQATGTAPTITLDPSDTQGITVNGNTWTYHNGTDTNSTKYDNNQLIWTESNGIYTIQRKVNGSGSAENFNGLNIRFSNNADHESTLLPLTIETWGSGTDKRAGLLVSKNVDTFTLDFDNKGLQLQGDNDTKKITLHFQDAGKTATISNLKSLDGSISIYGDSGAGANTYNIALGTMVGSILIGGDTAAKQKGTITFNQNGLTGNIMTDSPSPLYEIGGNLTVNFNGASTMTGGNIKGFGTGNDSIKKVITFNTTAPTALNGNIFSYGTGENIYLADSGSNHSYTNSGNHITFQNGNMQGSIIATEGNARSDSKTGAGERKGYNDIAFSKKGEQTLTGGILAKSTSMIASPSGKVTHAKNQITIGEGTTLKILQDGENSEKTVTDENSSYEYYTDTSAHTGLQVGMENKNFTVTTGSIIADSYGENDIILNANSTLSLNNGNGSIITRDTSTNANKSVAKSFLTFSGANATFNGNIATSAGTATIAFNSTGGNVNGTIQTSDGTSVINIADAKDGTITGSITKSGSGAYNITYASGSTTGTLTLKGATNAISTLTTTTQSGGASTLNIDASANSNTTEISRVTNNLLVVNFNSTNSNTATLSLTTTGLGLTIKDVDVAAGEKNILVLGGTDTATISDDVTITTDKGIAFDLSSGSNINFSGSGGITTAGTTTFKLGGENTITGTLTNNGTHNFVISKDTTLKYGSDGLTFTSGNNNIDFIDNATLDWKNTGGQSHAIATSGSSTTTTINVANTKNATINDSITTANSGTTNIVLGNASVRVDNVPTPTTLILKGETNQITLLTANDSNSKLSLIADGHNNTTTLGSVSGNNKLTVNFNGITRGADKYIAKLTLNGNANLKAITLEADSTNNTFEVAGGITAINNKLSVANGQKIDFEVSGTSRLIFTGGLENTGGVITLQGTGNSGQAEKTSVVGNITTNNEYAKTNLYFKDSLWAPNSTSTREGTISSGTVTVSGGESNIAVDLSGASGVTQMPIYNVVTDGAGAKNNILVKGPTHIGAQVTYGLNGETNLIFVSEADATQANLNDGTDLNNLNDGISMFGKTFSNGVLLTLKDVNVASGSSTASFLSLAGKDGSTPVFGFTTKRETTGGTSKDTVTLSGVAVGSIQAIGSTNPTQHFYDVILEKNAIFTGKIALYGDNQVINLSMNEASKLFINNSALHLQNLTINSPRLDTSNLEGNSFTQNNVVIDLATDGNSFDKISRNVQQDGYRVLVIGAKTDAGAGTLPYDVAPTGLSGSNGLFRVYVDPNQKGKLGKGVNDAETAFATYDVNADRVFVNSGSQGKHYVQAIYAKNTDIESISYHGGGVEKDGNIAIATVQKDLNITFEGATQVQGFELIGTQLTDGITTNAEGKYDEAGAYKTFFIGSTISKGVSNSAIQTTSSALGINYDLFLANFNSLNKRMGELRDNNNGQGAWTRVFVGGLSTSYGLETQSTYTTIQAGYDYAFGFEGANNYLGVALSYANALTDTKKSIDVGGVVSGIDKTSTNGIEVALYNSYVEDSGWFNDTIFKFSYMVSDVKVLNQADTYNTNNFGIVLSDEFGYRFKLGESKEWYIDPQLEVGFGYFNQSDLKQVLGDATLTGIQDAIVTLRARVGANWAYDFKNFTQGKGISASVYLGTYYSYDFINGGEIDLATNFGTTAKITPLSSTGRFELNVGTNIGVYDNTRIYFDFEKSFGGDITTDYQVNLGVRYSFGESNGYTPAIKTESAPLKVSDEKPQEQSAQESVSSEEKAQ